MQGQPSEHQKGNSVLQEKADSVWNDLKNKNDIFSEEKVQQYRRELT